MIAEALAVLMIVALGALKTALDTMIGLVVMIGIGMTIVVGVVTIVGLVMTIAPAMTTVVAPVTMIEGVDMMTVVEDVGRVLLGLREVLEGGGIVTTVAHVGMSDESLAMAGTGMSLLLGISAHLSGPALSPSAPHG